MRCIQDLCFIDGSIEILTHTILLFIGVGVGYWGRKQLEKEKDISDIN